MTMKQDVIKSLGNLPEDASADDIADQVYVVLTVERRLAETAAGHKVSDEEARKRMKRWLE